MSDQPSEPDTPAPPTVPDPVPRPPLIERVTEAESRLAAVEDRFTQLAQLHNAFAQDVARELGLS